METEYKYRVANDTVLQDMLRVNRLAGMPLGPVRRILVNDCYFDTAYGTLLEFGYSCRLRESHTGDRTITIKSLTTSSDGLHVREEFELPLRFGVPIENVHRWPEGVVRDLVADLIHEDRLEELFAFNQERFQRLLPDGEFPQVEVSFDRVSLGGPDAPVLCWVEAELLERGDAALLTQAVDELRGTWQLIPESRAKFWWALAAMRPDLARVSEVGDELEPDAVCLG